jgi:hypothetical protein
MADNEIKALRKCPHCKTHLGPFYLVTGDELHRWMKIAKLIHEEVKILMELPHEKGETGK